MKAIDLSYLTNWLSGKDDFTFLDEFKGDWNRTCNYYIDHVVGRTIEYQVGNFVSEKIDTLKKFGRLYETFLKYKFLPDLKFVNVLDKPFWDTLKEMHLFLGENPFPQDRQLSKDASYDIRYRGVMLIEYLQILSKQRLRYYLLTIVKISIYLIPIISACLLFKQLIK